MDLSLAQLMSVEPAETTDEFVGRPESYGALGIYGGHFVGQALAAGLATVPEPKLAHSLHCYFLRPGDPNTPIQYSVVRLREGRSSDVRSVVGSQKGQAVFQMTCSFKLPEDGDEHQREMPTVESAETLLQSLGENQRFTPPPTSKGRSEMVLASEHFIQQEFVEGRAPELRIWMRCANEQKLTDREAQTALAFLSDSTLLFNSVIPHGLPFQTHRLTSIDHSVWFHRSCDVTQWMLFDQVSSAAADGRGLNHGMLFDADGRLVMSASQESLLRRVPQLDNQ
jgi:acyl-CoA thioesterase-2